MLAIRISYVYSNILWIYYFDTLRIVTLRLLFMRCGDVRWKPRTFGHVSSLESLMYQRSLEGHMVLISIVAVQRLSLHLFHGPLGLLANGCLSMDHVSSKDNFIGDPLELEPVHSLLSMSLSSAIK